MKKAMIKTVDTDVVVLAISFFSKCSLYELRSLVVINPTDTYPFLNYIKP